VIVATIDDYGKRLDLFVADSLGKGQRSRMAELIRQHAIVVNGRERKPSYKVRPGDVVRGVIPPLEPLCFEPEAISLDILYDDPDVVVINKPPGLVVHPAPGNWSGTLVNGLLYHYPDLDAGEDDVRPGIVHRLDRDTSGVMVVAKNQEALSALSTMFHDRKVGKRYVAIVHGVLPTDSGIIDLPVGRHPVDRKKMCTHSTRGRRAETHYTVERRYIDATRLLCDIKTGRTHQIRVHCQAIQHPIVGDPVYGLNTSRNRSGVLSPSKRLLFSATRQMLHAAYLTFDHPRHGHSMTFTAPLPPDMQNLLDRLKDIADDADGSPSRFAQ
jgi:23S rRNA pseudouridine1911/1915/1917 synthase